jgi:hypothetical protein
MKLALYLPNFRDKVTVKELEDLTALAEDLDFDSVWTLDRIIVPEASDRGELQYAFGMMEGFPKQLPVTARGEFLQGMPLIPWLAAKTTKVRIGMSIIDTPYRSPGVLAAELATIDHLSNGRLNVGVGSGWMPEEFAAASASHIFPKRHKHLRETIEIMQGIWTNDLFEYHGEFADFERSGFGAKPVQQPHPPIYFSGLKDAKRSALRIAKYGLAGSKVIMTLARLPGIERYKGVDEVLEIMPSLLASSVRNRRAWAARDALSSVACLCNVSWAWRSSSRKASVSLMSPSAKGRVINLSRSEKSMA